MADGPTEISPDLSQAANRLDKALAALETRIRTLKSKAASGVGDLFDRSASSDSAELEAALARKRELESAAKDASAALGRAAADMRAILNGEA